MKLFKFDLIFVALACLIPLVSETAVYASDYTTMNLPEGAIARFGKGTVDSIEFSPDGNIMAVASELGIWIYDLQTYKEVALLKDYNFNEEYALAFSPNGQMLASGQETSSTIKLWSIADKREIATLKGHNEGVSSLAFSPDGQMLLSNKHVNVEIESIETESEIKLWSIADKREIATLKGHNFEFSPDGQILASVGHARHDDSAVIKLWSVADKREIATLKGHSGNVDSLVFSPDGQMLATGGEVIKLWSIADKREIATLKGHNFEFSPDGQILGIIDTDSTIKLWSVAKRREVAILGRHKGIVDSLAFSPDGQMLATGGEVIKLWSIADKHEIATLKGHRDIVHSIVFSPNGQMLASENRLPVHYANPEIKLWSVADKREIAILTGCLDSVAFSPNGQIIASRDNGGIKLWSIADKREVATLKGHGNSVDWRLKGHNLAGHFVFSPDGQMLASREGSEVRLWSVANEREIAILKGHPDEIDVLAFSPDGQILASGSSWHGTLPASAEEDPDGQILGIIDTNSIIKLWSVADKREIAVLKGHPGEVSFLAFSPDGQMLLSYGEFGVAWLWDLSYSGVGSKMPQPIPGNPTVP